MNKSVDQRVARNVRAELARRGLSQATIANSLGLSQAAVSRRLLGTTSFSIAELERVAEVLPVPIAVLLADEPADPSAES